MDSGSYKKIEKAKYQKIYDEYRKGISIPGS